MVDIHALNMVLSAVAMASAVAIGAAASAIALTWLAGRRRHLRHVAAGIRSVEAHLVAAAKDRAIR